MNIPRPISVATAGLLSLASATTNPNSTTEFPDNITLGTMACSSTAGVEDRAYQDMAMASLKHFRPQPELRISNEERQRLIALNARTHTAYSVVHKTDVPYGEGKCRVYVDLPSPELFDATGMEPRFEDRMFHQDDSIHVTNHRLGYSQATINLHRQR